MLIVLLFSNFWVPQGWIILVLKITSYKATLTKDTSLMRPDFRYIGTVEYKFPLPLKRDLPSYKVTFSLPKRWPYWRGSID
jgi:hypothetical protein